MKPSRILSKWFFDNLAGTFVDKAVLYVSTAQVAQGRLELPIGNVAGQDLYAGYTIANGQVYPVATTKEIEGAYVIYDNITTLYEATKDGTTPSSLTARVLCVDKTFDAAEALADAVEDKLIDAYIAELGCITLESRKVGYDSATGEFLEEFNIKIEL
jgi:hypothetical protein